jgi:hypothetical protein
MKKRNWFVIEKSGQGKTEAGPSVTVVLSRRRRPGCTWAEALSLGYVHLCSVHPFRQLWIETKDVVDEVCEEFLI